MHERNDVVPGHLACSACRGCHNLAGSADRNSALAKRSAAPCWRSWDRVLLCLHHSPIVQVQGSCFRSNAARSSVHCFSGFGPSASGLSLPQPGGVFKMRLWQKLQRCSGGTKQPVASGSESGLLLSSMIYSGRHSGHVQYSSVACWKTDAQFFYCRCARFRRIVFKEMRRGNTEPSVFVFGMRTSECEAYC